MILITSCASKFAPVVSRPDNLVIDCPTGCKLNIPMNTEIIVAKNTNGYDMGISLVKQIPFLGALALSWKSMDVAENLGEIAIDSFNRGASNGSTTNINTTTTSNRTTGDTTTTTSGDYAVGDSGSNNTTRGDVANISGDEVGGDNAGGNIDKSVTANPTTTTYSNTNNDQSVTDVP